jgi:hypothetical protein
VNSFFLQHQRALPGGRRIVNGFRFVVMVIEQFRYAVNPSAATLCSLGLSLPETI